MGTGLCWSLCHQHPLRSPCSQPVPRQGYGSCLPANKVSCAGQGGLLTFPALGAPGRTGEELPALGKGCAVPAHPSCLGRRSCSPGEEEPSSFWEKSSEARHESELVQLSTQVTVERLNMDKCCRFIHNVSFYLWNVSEWSKDTKNVVRNCS